MAILLLRCADMALNVAALCRRCIGVVRRCAGGVAIDNALRAMSHIANDPSSAL
jgi:hypothetical protein